MKHRIPPAHSFTLHQNFDTGLDGSLDYRRFLHGWISDNIEGWFHRRRRTNDASWNLRWCHRSFGAFGLAGGWRRERKVPWPWDLESRRLATVTWTAQANYQRSGHNPSSWWETVTLGCRERVTRLQHKLHHPPYPALWWHWTQNQWTEQCIG